MKKPEPLLLNIIDYCNTALRITKNATEDQFQKDETLQLAVIKALEIIGEASNQLENDFRQSYPEIPWQAIISFRNRVVHQYWDIDPKVVWRIATKDTLKLKKQISPILEDLQTQEAESHQ